MSQSILNKVRKHNAARHRGNSTVVGTSSAPDPVKSNLNQEPNTGIGRAKEFDSNNNVVSDNNIVLRKHDESNEHSSISATYEPTVPESRPTSALVRPMSAKQAREEEIKRRIDILLLNSPRRKQEKIANFASKLSKDSNTLDSSMESPINKPIPVSKSGGAHMNSKSIANNESDESSDDDNEKQCIFATTQPIPLELHQPKLSQRQQQSEQPTNVPQNMLQNVYSRFSPQGKDTLATIKKDIDQPDDREQLTNIDNRVPPNISQLKLTDDILKRREVIVSSRTKTQRSDVNSARLSEINTARSTGLIQRQEEWLKHSRARTEQLKQEFEAQKLSELKPQPDIKTAHDSWQRAKQLHAMELEKQNQQELQRLNHLREQEEKKLEALQLKVEEQAKQLALFRPIVKKKRRKSMHKTSTTGDSLDDNNHIHSQEEDHDALNDLEKQVDDVRQSQKKSLMFHNIHDRDLPSKPMTPHSSMSDALDALFFESNDRKSMGKKSVQIEDMRPLSANPIRTYITQTPKLHSNSSNSNNGAVNSNHSNIVSKQNASQMGSKTKRSQSANQIRNKVALTPSPYDIEATQAQLTQQHTGHSNPDYDDAAAWFQDVMRQRRLAKEKEQKSYPTETTNLSRYPSALFNNIIEHEKEEKVFYLSDSDDESNRHRVAKTGIGKSLKSKVSEEDLDILQALNNKSNTSLHTEAPVPRKPPMTNSDSYYNSSPFKEMTKTSDSLWFSPIEKTPIQSVAVDIDTNKSKGDNTSFDSISTNTTKDVYPTHSKTDQTLADLASITSKNLRMMPEMPIGFFDSSSTSDKGRHRVNDAREFSADSVHRIQDEKHSGVTLLCGTRRGSEKTEVITVLFNRDVFSESDACKWWQMNKDRYV